MYVVNRTRGTFLGVDVKRASTLGARMLGLYRHRNLSLGDGVGLIPCNGIQTVGMKHVIDAIFLDAQSRVVRIHTNVKPGSLIWWVPKARSVLEVPAGAVKSSETCVGDDIYLADTLPTEVADRNPQPLRAL